MCTSVYGKIREFQFHQDTKGFATAVVVPVPGSTKVDIQPFVDEISKKVGSSINFSLKLTDKLHRNSRGKLPFIVQKLKYDLPL